MAKYKAYPEYKDSGVEWLGEIPEDWSVTKLKYIADLQTAKSNNSDELFVGLENISSGDGKYISKEESIADGTSVSFEKNDVLFGKLRPYLAKSWLATFSGVCSSEFLVLRTAELHPKYLNYYSLTNEFIEQVNSSTYGSKMPRASWEFIGLLPVPMCSYFLSERVAWFLDHETAKIDNLIEKQQQLIELLKEKRQAVISHAVTKGLNPDVPMKDSGVEWLGPIAQNCIITKLKYLTVLKTEKIVSNNIRYVGMENISSGTGKFLSKDEVTPEGTSVSFECNDVLFGKLRPYLAKSWLATFSGICSSEFLVLQSRKIYAGYLNYYLLTNEFIKQVDSSTYGSKMPRANWDFISQLPVPTWTYEESKAIAVYLDNLTEKLDCLLEKQNQQVNLLQERRTALISAAVTGKIDVRDWVAPDTQEIEKTEETAA
ncbi:restriction endonuclease subunit S [Morganella morganii]|uniref:restriction endonuclease subunit S n=1 Tax=Morganella morganii TaxID=582 RepID=UPI0032DB63E6